MEQGKYKAHLFVCTNGPQLAGKCGARDSEKLRSELKDKCRQAFGKDHRVRINASGCLDRCEVGITAVLYPEGKWLTGLKANDVEPLFDLVKTTLAKPDP